MLTRNKTLPSVKPGLARVPLLASPWTEAFHRFLEGLQAAVGEARKPLSSMIQFSLLVILAWHVYVPVHELLHVAGCLLAGGEVRAVELHPLFGGRVLGTIFPFIRPSASYSGRVSDFDTGGSDFVYLATDFAPFLLTIGAALPCLTGAKRKRSRLLLAIGTVLGLSVPSSIPGDLYEMGSILVGRALGLSSTGLTVLRSDDLFELLSEFGRRFPDDPFGWGAAVAASFLVGLGIGTLILAASRWVADRVVRPSGAP